MRLDDPNGGAPGRPGKKCDAMAMALISLLPSPDCEPVLISSILRPHLVLQTLS